MSDHITRLFNCFALAQIVTHHYWNHTDGDKEDLSVSVENIQKIIGLMTGLRIFKELVAAESQIIRGWVERYEDEARIYVVEAQDEFHQRFTTVKELSQVLFDDEEEFDPDPVATLKDLTTDESFGLRDGLSPVLQSERLAEMLALELLYPLEYRRRDKKEIENGKDFKEIVEKRKLPAVYVQRAVATGYLDACEELWKALESVSNPPPLV